jgi:hypothetical protein
MITPKRKTEANHLTFLHSLGRLQPFVAVTQSIAFAMPAKGNLRPETAIRGGLGQRPLTDQKGDIRADCCSAEYPLVSREALHIVPNWLRVIFEHPEAA